MLISRKTPTGPMPCSRGTGPTPRRMRPNGRGALREAGEYGALAQEVGAYREALTEVAEARRRWHAATELDRQRALIADTELRRRHPEAELPPLHTAEEAVTSNAAHEASGSVSADQQMTPGAAAQETAEACCAGDQS